MAKRRRAKLEAVLVFVALFLYGLYSTPGLVKWRYFSNPNTADFDTGLTELLGAMILPGILSFVW